MRKLAFLLLLFVPDFAAAQMRPEPLGAIPFDFRDRSPTASLTLQENRDNRGNANGKDSGCGLCGALLQNSITYAVGNWNQITMTLGDGATGMINNEAHQSNWGNPTATSNIDSQNAKGDQTLSNGGDWSGSFDGQTIGNTKNIDNSNNIDNSIQDNDTTKIVTIKTVDNSGDVFNTTEIDNSRTFDNSKDFNVVKNINNNNTKNINNHNTKNINNHNTKNINNHNKHINFINPGDHGKRP